MAMSDAEIETVQKELQWLLREEVHTVLEDIRHTLSECSKYFPTLGSSVADYHLKPQRILLSSSSMQQVKCMVSLRGDSICETDINFKHKQGKEHVFKTGFHGDQHWKLQQIQDAGNHLCEATAVLNEHDRNYVFKSAKEAMLLMDRLSASLMKCKESLALPKRKSVEELINSRNLQLFEPPLPADVALSFYVHSSKLIMALYHLHHNGQQKVDISSRVQVLAEVESVVQWLSESIVLFSLALQQCQQFRDKVMALTQYDLSH